MKYSDWMNAQQSRNIKKKPRVCFLYSWDWSHELNDHADGAVPAHRLFGYAGLKQLGHEVSLVRLTPLLKRLITQATLWKLFQAVYAALKQNSVDVYVCTTEAPALPVLALKRAGLLRKPVVVLNVALLEPRNCSGWRRWSWETLLPCANAIVSYASAQLPWLHAQFSVDTNILHFIPFGVDTAYFRAEPRQPSEPFLLSVGTNQGKDYSTFLDSLPDSTKVVIVTDNQNQRIIQSHPKSSQVELKHDIPILELRQLYRDAIAQVIPLHETKFSSGQTVMLENMAMGKITVVTDTSATRDYIFPGVRTFRPGDTAALRTHLSEIVENSECTALNYDLSQHVQDNFSSSLFAERLSTLLSKLVERSAS